MKDLLPPDIHHFNAAQGWLGLNSPSDAQAELDKISVDFKTHLLVLELQWQIDAKRKLWQNAVQTATAITREHPLEPFGWTHLAYALHELRRTIEAYDVLKPVLDRFPKDWLMRYNMACYAVQMGRLDEAKVWLNFATEIGDKKEIAELISTDPDLEPLRRASR